MFVVPKKDGGWRPIINLRKLNAFLSVSHFKMESINSVKDVIQENDYMGKIDLKDAYLTVPVWEKHRKYLKFAWGGQCYQFKSLTFGLATAPRTFTKLLRPVAVEMRRKGVRLIMYLDDTLVMAQTRESLKEHLSQMASVLQSLGFTLNQQKCVWEPTRRIEFLGFIVDSETQVISLPGDKLSKIRKKCRSMSSKDRVTGCQLAWIIGLLSSAIPAILPAPLHYRALQRLRYQAVQQSQGNYESAIHLSTEAQRDLHWWIHDVPHYNGRPIPAPTADLVITSDASKTGWGATCQEIHTGGPWGAQERAEHINLLELKAAFLALQTFASHHSGLHILLLIDNITAIAYINHKGGTQSWTLTDQAIELWEWCLVRKITVHAEHIPGQKNIEADAESRRALDQSDWMLKQIFQALEMKWGPFDVDLFTARHNKQLKRFFSFRPDPEAEAVDALAQPWMNIRPYAFPLFIGVQEIVIIALVWQGQPWFPPLIESLIDFPTLLPQAHNLLANPAGDPHSLVVRNRLYLAAWRLSGAQSRIREFQERLSKSYAPHGEEVQRNPILQPGESGVAGVVRGRLIPFQDL